MSAQPIRLMAEASGITLDKMDVALIKGMLQRGDRQHDIAAFFGVNGGRIAEIAGGKKWEEVPPAAPDVLPPSGPYLTGRNSIKAEQALVQARDAIDAVLRQIRENR